MQTTSNIAVVPERGAHEPPPGIASQAATHIAPSTGSFQQKTRSIRGRKNNDDELVQPSAEDWKSQEPDVLAKCYEQIQIDFFGILNDYFEQANTFAHQYRAYSLSHARWRFWTIIATGALAAINICAAIDFLKPSYFAGIALPSLLSGVAAVYAGCLTIAGNVENLLNLAERAAGFRKSRDIVLSQYREYCAKWVNYVEAFGNTPLACTNASRLYRQLVESDEGLRQKLGQLMEVGSPGRPQPSPGAPR